MAITRAQQVRQMYKEGSKEPVEQAGVINYMPSEMVTVPKIAKSSPTTPTAKLAYITPEEQDILIDLNLYGSLDGKPNRGPGGIPSLEGDFGSPTGQASTGAGTGGTYSGGGGGSRSDNDVSGRRDTGTGNYRDSTRPDDVAARKEYEVNRKKREAEARKNRDKEAEKKDRKEVKEFLRTTKKAETDRRRKKINRILTGDFPPVRIGDKLYRNQFGLPENELADLIASGIDPNTLTEDAVSNLFEKNDRFSGVNLEAFQNEFNLPKTGLTSLDIALGFAEPFLRKNSKKTKEFFSGTEDGLGNTFFGLGPPRKSVLEAGKYKFDGNVVTPDMFALMDPALMDDVYKDYMGKRMSGETDAYGNPTNLNTGPDPDPIDPCKGPNPPAYCNVNNTPADPATPKRNLGGLAPRFAGSIFDFTGLANGGRAGMMDGGMMDDDPTGGIMDLESGRQMYFLGKLVKKATRAVKKVAKSPFGKAALGAALFKFGGGFGGGSGKGLSSLLSKGGRFLLGTKGVDEDGGTMGLLGKLGLTGGFGGFKPTLKGGLALGLGIPFALDALGIGKKDDEGFDIDDYYKSQGINIADVRMNPYNYLSARNQGSLYAADGGLMRTGYQEGGDAEPVAKKTMPLLDMDGMEKDYREEGGFVPIGRMERADDVPARLSKNEFVFTADAVRNAGEGDIDKGAEVMYNMMKNLESGGEVSEESQGLDGAREMFKTSQRLEEVL